MEHPEPDVGDAGEQVEPSSRPWVSHAVVRPVGAGPRRRCRCGSGLMLGGDGSGCRSAPLAAAPMAIPSGGAADDVHGPVDTHVHAGQADRGGDHPRDPPHPGAGAAGGARWRRRTPASCGRTGSRSRWHGRGRWRPARQRLRARALDDPLHHVVQPPGHERGDGDRHHRSGSLRQVGHGDRRRSAPARRRACPACITSSSGAPIQRGQPFTASNSADLAPHEALVRHQHRARGPAAASAAIGAVKRSDSVLKRRNRSLGSSPGVDGPVGDDAVERQRGEPGLGGQILEPAVHPQPDSCTRSMKASSTVSWCAEIAVAPKSTRVARGTGRSRRRRRRRAAAPPRGPRRRPARRSGAPRGPTAPTAASGRACPDGAARRPPRRPRRGPSCRWRSPSRRAGPPPPRRRWAPAHRSCAAWLVGAPSRSPTTPARVAASCAGAAHRAASPARRRG